MRGIVEEALLTVAWRASIVLGNLKKNSFDIDQQKGRIGSRKCFGKYAVTQSSSSTWDAWPCSHDFFRKPWTSWAAILGGWTLLSLLFAPEVYLYYFLSKNEALPFSRLFALTAANTGFATAFAPSIIWLTRRFPLGYKFEWTESRVARNGCKAERRQAMNPRGPRFARSRYVDNQANGERVHLSIRGQGILSERGIRGTQVLYGRRPIRMR